MKTSSTTTTTATTTTGSSSITLNCAFKLYVYSILSLYFFLLVSITSKKSTTTTTNAFSAYPILTTTSSRRNSSGGGNHIQNKWSIRNDDIYTRLEELSAKNDVWGVLEEASVLDPISGTKGKALDGVIEKEGYVLVVVMPQLGDFDSGEYAELLSFVKEDLNRAKITLRIIGIGDRTSAKRFANFSGLDLSTIRVDSNGNIHRLLGCHKGPDWDIPSFIPNGILDWFASYAGVKDDNNDDGSTRDSNAISRAWLNYMAMCAGIASPDTLPEIFRGYIGDKNSPERIRSDEIVTVGGGRNSDDENTQKQNDPFISITGTTDVKLGPFKYQQSWKDESGYQRPLELATVRLRIMVEVLQNFAEYVPDQRYLDLRGATYLFRYQDDNSNHNDDISLVYEHIDTGVLSYSKTMGRPLSFLEPYIGKKALNPLGLKDSLLEGKEGTSR